MLIWATRANAGTTRPCWYQCPPHTSPTMGSYREDAWHAWSPACKRCVETAQDAVFIDKTKHTKICPQQRIAHYCYFITIIIIIIIIIIIVIQQVVLSSISCIMSIIIIIMNVWTASSSNQISRKVNLGLGGKAPDAEPNGGMSKILFRANSS